jgi:hypothetical protein
MPDRKPSAVGELAIGLATFALYLVVDSLGGPARTAAARAHALQLFGWERSLRLDVEPAANAWLDLHPVLRTLANYEYGSTYIIAAFGLLGWLYLRRPDEYRRARSSFVLLNLVAIGCFALYPVMPPRLVAGQGFIDTVTQGHTVGSWGSPLVAHANQLAAMPSLHVGWALWVSVVLARLSGSSGPSGGWGTQLFSAAHVALTGWVVVATANHYLLDAAGAVLLVAGCLLAQSGLDLILKRMRTSRVPAADAFFLHIETADYPQQVGGVVPLRMDGRGPDFPSGDDVAELIRGQLPHLPRFRQLLVRPESRWRRAHWREAETLDWAWHVPVYDVTGPDGQPGGQAGLDRVVAELAATRLPQDRPLWRMAVVHGIEADLSAVILLVHHVIADGIGTVAQAMHLLEPPQVRASGSASGPGVLRRGVAVALGLGQLASDGRAAPLESGGVGSGGAGRDFARVTVPLSAVRQTARGLDARVSDLLLCAVAGGLARLELPILPPRLRVAVPLMVREPDAAAEGNVTAAVMIDLPVRPMPEPDRLREIAGRSRRLRTGSRALASRFVMASVGGWMPVPLHAWFARTVYGSRYFHAIVSNMPGPDAPLTLAKASVVGAYPLLPLAPGTALTVGTLGWNGSLCLALTTGGWLEPHTGRLVDGIRAALRELGVSDLGLDLRGDLGLDEPG